MGYFDFFSQTKPLVTHVANATNNNNNNNDEILIKREHLAYIAELSMPYREKGKDKEEKGQDSTLADTTYIPPTHTHVHAHTHSYTHKHTHTHTHTHTIKDK